MISPGADRYNKSNNKQQQKQEEMLVFEEKDQNLLHVLGALFDQNILVSVQIFKCNSCSTDYGSQRIFGNVDG